MKDKDIVEAEKSLAFLSLKLAETNINDLQQGISGLMLQQIQKINLSEITDEYALKVVDSPFFQKGNPVHTDLGWS